MNAVETESGPSGGRLWAPERRPWGAADALALAVWTAALVAFFWNVVTLRGALFYFDITEINFAYRDFLAQELRAGRFSRWHPGLYCGLPLYSESQAGYLHPLKYLLYPWMATWKAFNLDTVLSVWLTGLGTYGWLRRHVGPSGALTGAAVFGLSGFVWAHLIHTSMNNALTSVPLIVWALEVAWERGRGRALVLGSIALACQVFAGHLQDTILTSGLIGLYALYRAATEHRRVARAWALGTAVGLIALGMTLAAVQWVPSKELLDRSPRAGGLTWGDLTYGSWHPELLPSLVVREAYGTRARDTDWMDGFYPYHEMNAYMGLIALGLALVGASAYRDRWVAFWIILAGVGGLLMLGRFTVVFDGMHRVPVVGSSRIPVRYHLWVSLAVASLAAVGVDRLARPGTVRLKGAAVLAFGLVLLSIPILIYLYAPVWTERTRFTLPYHIARYRWLGRELALACLRTVVLCALAWQVARAAARTKEPGRRAWLAAALPVLVIADLLGAHNADVPTITPKFWTDPPLSARKLRADPRFERVFGIAEKSAGEPGYASEPIDFLAARDTLDWSLPPVWGLASARGETPIIPLRRHEFSETAKPHQGRFDLEGVSHVVAGRGVQGGLKSFFGPGVPAGSALIFANLAVFPRARLAGRPAYAVNQGEAVGLLKALGSSLRERLVVEDPARPLAPDANVRGDARVIGEGPERVEIDVRAATPAYLVLSDTYDPGWSATLDGKAASILPAYVAFRAVYVPEGHHTVIMTYEPAGFRIGLLATGIGLALSLGLSLWPRRVMVLAPEHEDPGWPRRWPLWGGALLAAIVLVSAIEFSPTGRPGLHRRWKGSVHPFTWGAGYEAMKKARTN